MVFVIWKLNVLPQKRREFLQTIPEIFSVLPQQQGCAEFHMCHDLMDEDLFFIFGEWESQQQLETHFRSDQFSTFLGTFHLMKEDPTLHIHVVSYTAGMEAVKAVRKAIAGNGSRMTKAELEQ